MMPDIDTRADAITAALAKTATHVTRAHRGAWDAVFRNGIDLPFRVELDTDWVRFNAPAPVSGTDLWPLLACNASLPPGVKLTVAVGDAEAPPVRLYGELILDDAAEPTARLLQLCAAFKTAAHLRVVPECARDDDWAPTSSLEIGALCHDTGWPVIERDGQALVELDVPWGFFQARVDVRPRGDVHAAVDVTGPVANTPQRQALALLLLRSSAGVRLVRAAANGSPRFEVALRPPFATQTLQHAFAALSIACRMAAREAAALAHDGVVAAAYLRHCGEPADNGPHAVEPSRDATATDGTCVSQP